MLKSKNINYIHFSSLDSTNNWVKTHAEFLDSEVITCITAKEQTAGRGRYLRKWISPREGNIYASLYFCIPKNSSYLPNLGQILSLSCCIILDRKGFDLKIKWPNDLLINGKKMGGVLCETVSFQDQTGVVLGIGLNVNMSAHFLKAIGQPATSLAIESGHMWDIEALLEDLLKQFINDLDIVEKEGFSYFHKIYEELLAFKGQTISVSDGLKTLSGICQSITPEGKLHLLLPNDTIISLSAGEIKLPD